jgi:hypothetical protein
MFCYGNENQVLNELMTRKKGLAEIYPRLYINGAISHISMKSPEKNLIAQKLIHQIIVQMRGYAG